MSIWELEFTSIHMGIGIYFYTHKKIYLFLRDGDLYPKLLVNKKFKKNPKKTQNVEKLLQSYLREDCVQEEVVVAQNIKPYKH